MRDHLYRTLNTTRRLFARGRATYPATVSVSEPNRQTVDFIASCGAEEIAEVGIYMGHTSLEIARVLDGRGHLHLFDFEDRVTAVAARLAQNGFDNVRTYGSSYKLLDSYNWPLGKLAATSDAPIFDYVFLDGAHTYAVDALAFFLCDRLLKVGGHIDFDDYGWTLAGSPSLRPERFALTAKLYTPEQIATPQVKMIVDGLVRTSNRYTEVVENKIFRKTC
jgi:predicted O-methyltransferase YrrM